MALYAGSGNAQSMSQVHQLRYTATIGGGANLQLLHRLLLTARLQVHGSQNVVASRLWMPFPPLAQFQFGLVVPSSQV